MTGLGTDHAADRSWGSPTPRPVESDAKQHGCRPFDAELDACELDERDRPTVTWTARALGLSESKIVLRSRRMCYVDRLLIIAVHLVDAEPVPLFGRVSTCDYDGDGMYVVELELLECPKTQVIRAWLVARAPRRRSA